MAIDHFLTASAPLAAADAVAALLMLDDGRYLVQLRDQLPQIFFPGFWGLFGGAIEPGEDPESALRRELVEELALEPRALRYFTRFDFDLAPLGDKKVFRIIFEVPVGADEVANLVLGEGAGMAALSAKDLLLNHRVAPYDEFAVWLHFHRARFGRGT